jgi:hypothetical protein
MATFHVYVEGPVEKSPAAVQRLAVAIAAKYGLPAADLVTRLSKGRFRVKANIDRATADTYAHALEQVGARVTIEEAHPTQPVAVTRAAATPSVPPATAARASSSSLPPANAPRPSSSSLPPSNVARPSSSSLPPVDVTKSKPAPMQSGLSAAFSGDSPAANLGALDALSLASLDGNDANEPTAAAFTPPSPPPATVAPAPSAAPVAKPVRPKDVPLDLFAPPEEGARLDVDLAVDEIEHRTRKSQSIPPANVAPTSKPLSPPLRRSTPSIQPPTQGTRTPDEMPRGRFALGVVLAICLGFIPAHVFASWRESSAYKAIDAEVEATQIGADTPEMYAALDSFRAAQLGRKKSERRNIALIALLVWAAAGGGLGFVWFRKIPWDRGTA